MLNQGNNTEHMLRWFEFAHLPPHLQAISAVFRHCADHVVAQCAPSAERTIALRRLLEGKDAAVRAAIETASKKELTGHIEAREKV